MPNDATTQVRRLIRNLERQGFKVTNRGGHYKVGRNGTTLVTLPATPSGGRSLANIYSELRRHGIDVRQRPHKRKNSTDEYALQRLRQRLEVVLQPRGLLSLAEFSRLVMLVQHERQMPVLGSVKSVDHAVRRIQQGVGSVSKPTHDIIAATLKVIESAGTQALARRVNEANKLAGIRPNIDMLAAAIEPEPLAPEPASEHTEVPEPPAEVPELSELRVTIALDPALMDLLRRLLEGNNAA